MKGTALLKKLEIQKIEENSKSAAEDRNIFPKIAEELIPTTYSQFPRMSKDASEGAINGLYSMYLILYTGKHIKDSAARMENVLKYSPAISHESTNFNEGANKAFQEMRHTFSHVFVKNGVVNWDVVSLLDATVKELCYFFMKKA